MRIISLRMLCEFWEKHFRSETDYQAALKEIENLIASQPGTPAGDLVEGV